MTRKPILAALLAATFAAAAAHAGVIRLYKGPEFRGAELTVRDQMRDLADADFDDATRSLIVRSGRWEVCSEPHFRGDCAVLGPGEYPRLDADLRRRVESVRDLTLIASADPPVVYQDYRRADRYDRLLPGGRNAVRLFAQPGFSGRALVFGSDTELVPSLDGTGLEERASSLVVREGTWQLCSEPDFRGRCEVYQPGRYERLGFLDDRVASMRRLR